MIRRMLASSFIFSDEGNLKVTTGCLLGLYIIFIFYIILARPYIEMKYNIFNIIAELISLLIIIFVFLIINEEYENIDN